MLKFYRQRRLFLASCNGAFYGKCGMQVFKLADKSIDFAALDECIREKIPSGAKIHDHSVPGKKTVDLNALYCYNYIRRETVLRSFGTLGGGNHFIEVGCGTDGED